MKNSLNEMLIPNVFLNKTFFEMQDEIVAKYFLNNRDRGVCKFLL